jgi:hypothetical protein
MYATYVQDKIIITKTGPEDGTRAEIYAPRQQATPARNSVNKDSTITITYRLTCFHNLQLR